MFVRSQALRNPSSRNLSKNAQELIRKDRISEILGDESWQSKMDLPEEILALAGSTDGSRKQEPKQAMKLLEFSDGPTKKHGWNVSSTKIKERRKVRLVENPDHKMAGRGLSVARAVPSNQSRPMSADDIQKAKMRAMYMQDKYGKTETPPGENNQQKAEPKPTSSSQANSVLPANRVLPQLPQIGTTEVQRPTKSLPHMMETPVNPKPNATSQEQLLEKLKKDRFRWQTPPEVRINPSWRVGAGENSKEVEIQTQRNGREKETLYSDPRDIPPNPKEPWDIDMDFDDSLTMEIPLEQETDLEPPDAAPAPAPAAAADAADTGPSSSTRDDSRAAAVEEPTASTSAAAAFPSPASTSTSNGLPEPDIELLAVLLKHPDIVYALTSGQGKNLNNNDMVALLDLVKTTGVGLAGIVNGLATVTKEVPAPVPVPVPVPEPVPEPEPEPTSLPSPTPPANAARVGWRSEFPSHGQSPQLQPQSFITAPNVAITGPNVASDTLPPPTIPMDVTHHTTANQMAFNHHQAQSLHMAPQVPTTILSLPQLTVTVNPRPPQPHPPQQQYQPAALQQHYQPAQQQQYQPAPNLQPMMMMAPSYGHAPLWQQTPNPPEIILPRNHYQANNPSLPSFPPPAPVKSQSHALPATGTYPPKAPAWPPSASASASAGNAFIGGQNLALDSRTGYPNNFRRNDPVYPVNTNNNNNNNNNNYNSNNMYPRRNGYANGSGMETWGPQSVQSRDVRYSQNNFSEQRRESGRSHQQDEGSRQGHSSRRHGEKRWRDRDYDRDRDRDWDRDRHRNRRR